MGRHLARRDERRRQRAAAAALPASASRGAHRLTVWRVLTGIVVPALLLVLWAGVTPEMRSKAPELIVFCAGLIALFPLSFVPWHPPRWIDRWHGRFLILGAVLGGCAAAVFIPMSVFALARTLIAPVTLEGWAWPMALGLVLLGPLLVGTARAYWRAADVLARRGFARGRGLTAEDLERTFE